MKERLKSLFVRSKETLETKTTQPALARFASYLAVALGLLVLPVGLYFNQTPDGFSIASIEAGLEEQNIRPVVGTRSVATLRLAEGRHVVLRGHGATGRRPD